MPTDAWPARSAGIGRWASQIGDLRPEEIVTLGEGDTPFVSLPRLARHLGVGAIYGKLESVNPTGSYKDRVAALTISLARAGGRRGWIATSSGNAGAALAAYGARAGLPGLLFVVPTIPREKLLPVLALGVVAVKVRGLGDEANSGSEKLLFEQVRAAAQRLNLQAGITAHAYNEAGMRGVDSLGLELAEQIPSDDCPVYIPCGGGGLTVAVDRGLRLGGSSSPVVIAQPSGCAPVVRYLDGELEQPLIAEIATTISALQLPGPPDGLDAAAAVRRSGGWGTSIPDDAILDAQALLARLEGVLVEPASAASVAAIASDVRTGRLSGTSCVVAVLTGSGLKNLASLERRPVEVRTIDAAAVGSLADSWLDELA